MGCGRRAGIARQRRIGGREWGKNTADRAWCAVRGVMRLFLSIHLQQPVWLMTNDHWSTSSRMRSASGLPWP